MYCDAIRVHADRIGDGGDVPFAQLIEAIARRDLGEQIDLLPAIERLRAADAPAYLSSALTLLAQRELACGELAEAARYADEAVECAQRSQRDSTIVIAHGAAARVAAADGRADDLRRHVAAIAATPSESLGARARAIRIELVGHA
jgi:hypothetical protein